MHYQCSPDIHSPRPLSPPPHHRKKKNHIRKLHTQVWCVCQSNYEQPLTAAARVCLGSECTACLIHCLAILLKILQSFRLMISCAAGGQILSGNAESNGESNGRPMLGHAARITTRQHMRTATRVHHHSMSCHALHAPPPPPPLQHAANSCSSSSSTPKLLSAN